MAEMIKDFLIVLSKGEAELNNGVVFIIDEQFEDDKGNTQFTLRRRDVNVERTSGNYLMKQIFGVNTFKGKEEVDKQRKCIFKQSNIMVLGNNPPRTLVAWADTFDELPNGIKSNKKWALILDMIYSADAKIEAEINTMKNAQTSTAEIWNTATASPSKYFEGMMDSLEKFTQIKLDSMGISKPMPGQQLATQNPMQQG